MSRPGRVPAGTLAAVLGALAGGSATAQDSVLVEPRFTVTYPAGHGARAEGVRAVLAAQPPLPGLSPGVPAGVEVILAHSEEAFREDVGAAVPEWGAAVAIPSRARIVLPSYPSERGRAITDPSVLRHEWAHVGLHQEVGGRRIPRWFSEGYAEWAGGWDRSRAWRLRVAFLTGRAPPLDSLVLGWPADRVSAEWAYLVAATAVEYLASGSGERGLEIFFSRWRESSFESALRQVYGVTSGQLENDWKAWVRRRYGWLYALGNSLVFWAALALVLAVMWRVRARHRRERMARMRADELPDDPAFWKGVGPDGPGTARGPGDGGP